MNLEVLVRQYKSGGLGELGQGSVGIWRALKQVQAAVVTVSASKHRAPGMLFEHLSVPPSGEGRQSPWEANGFGFGILQLEGGWRELCCSE